MPRMYPATVRRQIVSRLRSGEPVAAVAVDTGICQATLFRWRRLDARRLPPREARREGYLLGGKGQLDLIRDLENTPYRNPARPW